MKHKLLKAIKQIEINTCVEFEQVPYIKQSSMKDRGAKPCVEFTSGGNRWKILIQLLCTPLFLNHYN